MSELSRYIDENGRRHYQLDGRDVLSVTTILDEMGTPEELTDWRERNDGEGDNANHEHLVWYKANRGTLLHYEALSMFEEAHDDPELFSEDEAQSQEELFDTHSPTKVYSVLKDKGMVDTEVEKSDLAEEIKLEDIYEEDKKVFLNAFRTIAASNNINSENVMEIEKMFISEPEDGIAYGGQIDLVYRNDDKLIVADLKTSSGVRDKHLLQGAAYAYAVSDLEDLDNLPTVQIIRIHPDSGGWSLAELDGKELEDKWEEFKDLARSAYDAS